MESEEAFSVLIPFLFRELEGERRKRKAGKTPGYRPIVGITNPECGALKYVSIISKIQKKIKKSRRIILYFHFLSRKGYEKMNDLIPFIFSLLLRKQKGERPAKKFIANLLL